MKKFLILSIFAALTFSKPEGCDGDVNTNPPITDEPKLVQSVPNGAKYTINYDNRQLYIFNLNGTAYDMGYAYGQLAREEMPEMISSFYDWAENYIETNVTQIAKLPKFIRKMIGSAAIPLVKGLLRLNYYITLPYSPSRWDEEMKGIMDGSDGKVQQWDLRQLNMIPELLQASCSVLGAWGKATNTSNVLHLRALDWEEHAPIAKWPAFIVYHSNEKGSVPFANIAWIGFLGSLTGYSSTKIGLGERLRGGPQSNMTRFGKPWTYVLRDTLQFSQNLDDALDEMQESKRTCSIYLGLGSGKENAFRIVKYSHKEFLVYDDTNWKVDDFHPRVDNLIWEAYHDGNACFKNVLMAEYGKITPETIYSRLVSQGQTGDSQVAVMDYANDEVYVQYANPTTHDPGFVRPAVFVDLKPFFQNTEPMQSPYSHRK